MLGLSYPLAPSAMVNRSLLGEPPVHATLHMARDAVEAGAG